MTDICNILKRSNKIAVVGISRNKDRTSRMIADYLVNQGYEVVGVNPNKSFIDADGIKVYNDLLEIPHPIDIVNVFRKSEDLPSLIDDIINANPKVLWLQLGIRNDSAVQPVKDKGIPVIQDRCIKIDYSMCR
jgi:predicted CoA-binding protein